MADDVRPVLLWFRDANSPAISVCCLDPESGTPKRIRWVKVGYGGQWLVLGDVVACRRYCACKYAHLPAPPCLVA